MKRIILVIFAIFFTTNLLAHSTNINFDSKANCTKKKSMLNGVAWAPFAMLPRPRPRFPTLISGGGGKAIPGRGRNAHFAAQFRKTPNFIQRIRYTCVAKVLIFDKNKIACLRYLIDVFLSLLLPPVSEPRRLRMQSHTPRYADAWQCLLGRL